MNKINKSEQINKSSRKDEQNDISKARVCGGH